MLPLQSFKEYIEHHSLVHKGDRILLAVSGGRDSVLMVHLFKQAGYQFGIAHCNFRLRAEESQRDEQFVISLAAALEVPCYVTHFDTKAYAAAQKISTQMAARDLRYRWFEKIRQEEGYVKIGIAHHQGDVIETVLLNLTRGTGIAGLHGIQPQKELLIRPLLFLSAQDIHQLIISNQIDFVEDSSNSSTAYARNKIRLTVVPVLRELNPNLEQTFQHNIRRFAETELVLQQVVAQLRTDICEVKSDGIYLSLEKVKALHPQRLLLFEILREYSFTENVVDEMLSSLTKQSGTSFYSSGYRLTVDREFLILTEKDDESAVRSNIMIHPADTLIEFDHQQLRISYSDTVFFENDNSKAFIDADLLIFPLVLRSWQDGDRFMPLGMSNYKKLSDFFVDQKIPLPNKEAVPILINGNGDIVWLAGLRQDNRYKVTATTKKVAIFEQKFIIDE